VIIRSITRSQNCPVENAVNQTTGATSEIHADHQTTGATSGIHADNQTTGQTGEIHADHKIARLPDQYKQIY
jgi:hypothetical protein